MKEFKDVFKGLRKSRQLTQDELASGLGLSRSAVSMYERGEREPDFETLETIADYFNVDMNYLTGWSDDPVNYDDPDLIASISLSYMEACNGDVERAFKMMMAVDQDAENEGKTPTPEGGRAIHEDDIKAAFWGGEKDFTQEELDEMWDDVREYARYKAEQRRKKKQE